MSVPSLTPCNFALNGNPVDGCTDNFRSAGLMDNSGHCATLGMPEMNLVFANTDYQFGPHCVNAGTSCSTNLKDFASVGITLESGYTFPSPPYYSTVPSYENCAPAAGAAPYVCIMKGADNSVLNLPCLYHVPGCGADDTNLGETGDTNQNLLSSIQVTTTNQSFASSLGGIILFSFVGVLILYLFIRSPFYLGNNRVLK
jgi:hypothetical protein